ncbi:MAG: O-acetyl-ADP-ribose deacetylase [Patescibacteria group bacterium]|nr:O-acetyl-ADP-ribose deacetylase [Patescibacteria group bacterium]
MNRIEIIKGDITKIEADATVNAANRTLLGGGGVDGAIHRAAGPELLEECKTLGGCKTGEAQITKGYNLPAKYIIHTVGPIYGRENGKEAELLASCYKNSLKLAEKYNLITIAVPSISTGAYHYPIEKAAKIAIQTVKDYFRKKPNTFDRIIFVLFSDYDYKTYQNLLN